MPILMRRVRAAIALAILSGADNTELFGGVDLLERLRERLRVSAARQRRKLMKHPEFHATHSSPPPNWRAVHSTKARHRGRGGRGAQEAPSGRIKIDLFASVRRAAKPIAYG